MVDKCSSPHTASDESFSKPLEVWRRLYLTKPIFERNLYVVGHENKPWESFEGGTALQNYRFIRHSQKTQKYTIYTMKRRMQDYKYKDLGDVQKAKNDTERIKKCHMT